MSGGMQIRWYRLSAAGIVLLAFLLRSYRFAELPPGLFFDEAYNVLDGLAVLHDGYHPVFFAANNGREPFYIYFQSLFLLLDSTAPFAVRLPSVFLGTLTVALTYPLMRRLLAGEQERRREMTALLATFLLATMQWHVNFSRIGFRAISQPLIEALACYLFYRGAQQLDRTAGGRRWWLWFLLSGAALGGALYTYLSARLLPVAFIVLAVCAVLSGQRLTRRYAVGLGLLALALVATGAPLGRYYVQHPDLFIGHSQDVSLLNFGGMSTLMESGLRVIGMFNWAGDVNWRHNLPQRPVFDPLIGLFFLAGIGVVAVRLHRAWRHGGRAPNGYLLPVAVLPVMLLPTLLSEGAPHFLRAIGVLPFLTLFPAVGIEAGWRWLQRRSPASTAQDAGSRRLLLFAALALLLGFTTAATYKGYFLDWGSRPEAYYHFDGPYLEFASYVKAQDPRFRVYLSPWLANHATARLFLRGWPYGAFDSERTLVLTTRDALYAFQEGGVDRAVSAAFPTQLPSSAELEHLRDRYGGDAFGFFRLAGAGDPLSKAAPVLGPVEHPAGVPEDATLTFGDDLALLGFVLGPQQDRAKGEHSVTAGITMPVTLIWRPTRPLADNYTASLRLLDKAGRAWLQSDSLAGAASYPSSQWRVEETIFDRPPLLLPADLPPGQYRLTLGVYALTDKRTLEARIAGQPRGQLATLAMMRVAEPAAGALAAMRPAHLLNAAFGSQLILLGYGLDRDVIKSGQNVALDLSWKAEQDVTGDFAVDVRLLDSRGQTVAERRSPPVNGDYPTYRWRAGNALHDTHRLTVGAKAAPGPASIRLALVDQVSGATTAELTLAGPEIAERPHLFMAPAMQFAAAAKFADKVELLGFTADESAGAKATGLPQLAAAAGAPLTVTLFWRGSSEMQTSYTVFVQLLNAQGQLVAQHDALPQDGAAPTSSWLLQEVIADRHPVVLRPDLPPGEYTLIAGIYNAMDGKRLPVGGSDFTKLAAVYVLGR